MKNLQDTLTDKSKVTIQTLVQFMNQRLNEGWEPVLQENKEELTHMFAEYGDRAYGVYIQKFMAPICDEIKASGFDIRSGFHLSDSVENWGPPEERERCAWYVIKDSSGEPIGSSILQIFHSHAGFHLPQPPRFLALEETDRDTIIHALSSTGVRLSGIAMGYRESSSDNTQQWEYSTDTGLLEYVQSYRGNSAVDFNYALSLWGRNGWELVQIVPYNDRLVGFFKRPVT